MFIPLWLMGLIIAIIIAICIIIRMNQTCSGTFGALGSLFYLVYLGVDIIGFLIFLVIIK